jgi:hypothetical protein
MKAKSSYNSVGAGAKPRLGKCSAVDMESRPGGAQSLASVKVSADIPKAARPGGATKTVTSGGAEPKAARPGGAQGI